MRQGLLLLAVLAALGLVACGGDDEAAAVDPDDFAACVEEDGFSVDKSTKAPETEEQAEAGFTISRSGDEFDISSLVLVLIYDSEAKAAVAAEEEDIETIETDHEGSVTWLYGDIGDGLDEELEDSLRSCAGA